MEYDLIVDDSTGLYRVQVKYVSGKYADLRRIHSNSSGYVVKRYDNGSYDWLYVYAPEKGEYLVREFPTGQTYYMNEKHKI